MIPPAITLTPEIEQAALRLQQAIGLRLSSVSVNFGDDGHVQNLRVQPELVIKRLKVKPEQA